MSWEQNSPEEWITLLRLFMTIISAPTIPSLDSAGAGGAASGMSVTWGNIGADMLLFFPPTHQESQRLETPKTLRLFQQKVTWLCEAEEAGPLCLPLAVACCKHKPRLWGFRSGTSYSGIFPGCGQTSCFRK